MRNNAKENLFLKTYALIVQGAFPAYGDLNAIIGVMLLVTVVNVLIKQWLDKRAED